MIKDTESLFKTREKEYQETIDQIEVRVLAVGLAPSCAADFLLAGPQDQELLSIDRRSDPRQL